MRQQEAEVQVKALQKAFLSWIEEHDKLCTLDPILFNEIRKRVFRATFTTFRMGVVGISSDQKAIELIDTFFGWLSELAGMRTELPNPMLQEIVERCFVVTLSAFRLGTLCRGND